jgi:hypothetical protein
MNNANEYAHAGTQAGHLADRVRSPGTDQARELACYHGS